MSTRAPIPLVAVPAQDAPALSSPPAAEAQAGPAVRMGTTVSHEHEHWVSLYAAAPKIYPRLVAGRFARWRWAMVFLTQLVFYGLPWLNWGGRQAVLFDLGARRFYVLGFVLYPQDIIYLSGLLVISALALFLFTAVAGRLWCGYTCPQTVYTEIFLWIEHQVEGSRAARMRLDAAPFSLEKLVKKWFKHLLWLMVALWTGFSFVGYFTPMRELMGVWGPNTIEPWHLFWILFYGLATYGNAGFMREQVCKYMCPYARFQSAMFDRDTLIVSYDSARGEPRGPRTRQTDLAAKGLGACLDCNLCVQVCPTGIDIRRGLQYECIGCGACADVCDTVMDKMGDARGLVAYTTQNAVQNGWPRARMWRRVLRPRVLTYTALLIGLVAALLFSLIERVPLKVDVVRDRGILARRVLRGQVENVYRLQIMNATERTQTYRISAEGLAGLTVWPDEPIEVAPAQSRWVPLRVQLATGVEAESGAHPIHFRITGTEPGLERREASVFLLPHGTN